MRRPLAALVALAVLAAGCGDDDDEEKRTVTVRGDSPIALAGDEYSFDPSGVVVSDRTRLEIRFKNDGSLAHNVKVLDGDDELGGTPSLPGGRETTAEVELPGPGEYRLVCTVGDHEDLGMTGTLRVR